MKVFIAHYTDIEAESSAALLRELAAHSPRHRLVSDPSEADLILVCGIGNLPLTHEYLSKSTKMDLITEYPKKSFMISYRDNPVIFLRGIYESGVRNPLSPGRVSGGSYLLSGSRNPKIFSFQEGDEVPRDREYLLTFIGRCSHICRRAILDQKFSRRDILVRESSNVNFWNSSGPAREQHLRNYVDALRASKFSLCPRGAGGGSIRLFDSMRLGIAPIIISDRWIPPAGVDWEDIGLTVKERDIPHLEQIVGERESEYYDLGLRAKHAYWRNFDDSNYFDHLVARCELMLTRGSTLEPLIWKFRHALSFYYRCRFLIRNTKRGKLPFLNDRAAARFPDHAN
jgi:hypothetical protein